MSNASIAPNTKFGAGLGMPSGAEIQVVAAGDVSGNLIRTVDAGAGDGTSFLGGAVTLISMQSAAYTGAQSPTVCATDGITYAALDMTLTSFTGGSAPTVNFFLERQGADGNWYQILATGALGTATTISVDISPALNGVVSGPLSSTVQHNVFTHNARLRWLLAGGSAPTSATFSASLVGR